MFGVRSRIPLAEGFRSRSCCGAVTQQRHENPSAGSTLRVLSVLSTHAEKVVRREDLRREVWPEDTFVEFDHALNTAVKKVRFALGDDAMAPRYVETISRRGYR